MIQFRTWCFDVFGCSAWVTTSVSLCWISACLLAIGCGKSARPTVPTASQAAIDVPAKVDQELAPTPPAVDSTETAAAPTERQPENAQETTDAAESTPAAQPVPVDDSQTASASVPQPTPEQLAKWAIPEYASLQLLDCLDNFGDVLIQSVAVTPDGSRFAVGGSRLTVWELGQSKPTVDLTESINSSFKAPFREIVISPDGRWLAGGDQNGTVWFWSLEDLKQVREVKAHDSYLAALAFSPNSKLLATTSYSGEVNFWNVADGTLVTKAKVTEENIAKLVFLTSDRIAVSGGESLIWNVRNKQREAMLSDRYVTAPGMTLSSDHSRLFYCDKEGIAHSRNIGEDADDVVLAPSAHAASLAAYSGDGRWLATANAETVLIIDTKSGQLQQAIDTDINATAAISWIPKTNLLLIASHNGKVRLWGRPEEASSAGVTPLQLPTIKEIDTGVQAPASAEQLARVIDLRTLPRLPDAVGSHSHAAMDSYATSTGREEVEAFYRYVLSKRGWTELPSPNAQSMINFLKQGCLLNVGFYDNPMPGQGALSVSLSLSGNYDSRWLPKLESTDSGNGFAFFTSSSYHVKGELFEIEAALIKLLHAQGWTGYSRLAASSNELPDMRILSFLRRGIEMTVMISHPADQPDSWSIQSSVAIAKKPLPIPTDSGWIEFDSSSDLMMVANTKMKLSEVVAFFDQQMEEDGWIARPVSRGVNEKEAKAWLSYIRGQYDVTINIQSLADVTTRIIVGDPSKFSWQLKPVAEPDRRPEQQGIEVADWPLPKQSTDVEYMTDQKQFQFNLPGVKPLKLVEQYSGQLADLGWQRSDSGVSSDEYVLAIFEKDQSELELRMRLNNDQDTSVSVAGDGLLWNKPLPTPSVASSFATWLMRNRYPASLDRIDEFVQEMKKLAEKK